MPFDPAAELLSSPCFGALKTNIPMCLYSSPEGCFFHRHRYVFPSVPYLFVISGSTIGSSPGGAEAALSNLTSSVARPPRISSLRPTPPAYSHFLFAMFVFTILESCVLAEAFQILCHIGLHTSRDHHLIQDSSRLSIDISGISDRKLTARPAVAHSPWPDITRESEFGRHLLC